MGYPKLVRNPQTSASFVIEAETTNEFGETSTGASGTLLCNWQGTSRTVYTSEKQAVATVGSALFDGDICPGVERISKGTVAIGAATYEIAAGQKCRNLDGTVNYTRLDVI